MIFLLILLFFYSISHYADITFMGISESSQWWTCFTFSLVHANFFHLLTNSIAFIFYWRYLKKYLNMWIVIPMLVLIPAISANLAITQSPTIGASAIVYVMIGIYMTAFRFKRKDFIKLVSLIILSFIITFIFAKGINTFIHIWSISLAIAVTLLTRRWIYEH